MQCVSLTSAFMENSFYIYEHTKRLYIVESSMHVVGKCGELRILIVD